jgi:hypothetical protein
LEVNIHTANQRNDENHREVKAKLEKQLAEVRKENIALRE